MKVKKKYKTYYLHTIGGQPAYYVKGKQIFYGDILEIPQHLVKSLNQIKREQKASCKYRKGWGWEESPQNFGYDYIIVRLPQ